MRVSRSTGEEVISIHAARREPRRPSRKCAIVRPYFNPRGSQGAATDQTPLAPAGQHISIHAARREPRLETRAARWPLR